jgi:Ni/Co efflux regulator RcnB
MWGMARLLLPIVLAAMLLAPASAGAHTGRSHRARVSNTTRRQTSTTRRQASAAMAEARKRTHRPTTNPVALSLGLAERYWHGVPACGTPKIVTSAHQLPNSDYESVTSPEPADSAVEMWTEVQTCTITINASLWRGWHQDDEFFQWFCDAMTHEVGHLFGHLDSGQTNPSSITYPFLDGTSPNFNSVPQCRSVTLQYGSEEIRDEEILHRR